MTALLWVLIGFLAAFLPQYVVIKIVYGRRRREQLRRVDAMLAAHARQWETHEQRMAAARARLEAKP